MNNYNVVLVDEKFKQYIYDLIEMVIIEFLKIEESQQIHIISNNIKENLNMWLSNTIDTFIDFYKNETRKIFDLIKNKKVNNYYNIQVLIEKSNNMKLKKNNKFNKSMFMNIISENLKNNFF